PAGPQPAPQLLLLPPVRQPAVPQQVGHFLEARVLGQVVDAVSVVDQHAGLAVDVAEGGAGRDDVLESCGAGNLHGQFLSAATGGEDAQSPAEGGALAGYRRNPASAPGGGRSAGSGKEGRGVP